MRHLDITVHTLHIKTKLCQLVEVMMQRRDDLAFRQEMKFRNKMVDYLTDWVMGNSHQIAPTNTMEVANVSKWVFLEKLVRYKNLMKERFHQLWSYSFRVLQNTHIFFRWCNRSKFGYLWVSLSFLSPQHVCNIWYQRVLPGPGPGLHGSSGSTSAWFATPAWGEW